MKDLRAKALVHIPLGSLSTSQGVPHFCKDLQHIQFQLQMKNGHLNCIEQHIPYILQTELPGSSAKDLTLVDSSDS